MNNLKELRKLAGMKQEVLANQLGAKQASISEWENGKKIPSLETAIQLADIFGVSLGCVAGLEPIPEGYGEAWTQPVFYSEVIENQMKAEQEGRLAKKPEKPPFSKAQMEFLKSRDDELVEKVVSALREDSSSLKEPEAR